MKEFTNIEFVNGAFTPEGLNEEFLCKWNNNCAITYDYYREIYSESITPLQLMVEYNRLDAVKYLVKNGAKTSY